MMRHAVLASARDPRVAWFPGSVAMAGCVALALVLASSPAHGSHRSLVERLHRLRSTSDAQLQFETPGGTRVVWVLNSTLDLPLPKDRQP